MRRYVIVCDASESGVARTEVVCIASSLDSANIICAHANAILETAQGVRKAMSRDYALANRVTDPELFKHRLDVALRPYRHRLASWVGIFFEAAFFGDENMRVVSTQHHPPLAKRSVEECSCCRRCGASVPCDGVATHGECAGACFCGLEEK